MSAPVESVWLRTLNPDDGFMRENPVAAIPALLSTNDSPLSWAGIDHVKVLASATWTFESRLFFALGHYRFLR